MLHGNQHSEECQGQKECHALISSSSILADLLAYPEVAVIVAYGIKQDSFTLIHPFFCVYGLRWRLGQDSEVRRRMSEHIYGDHDDDSVDVDDDDDNDNIFFKI